jgi:hypothetical protein
MRVRSEFDTSSNQVRTEFEPSSNQVRCEVDARSIDDRCEVVRARGAPGCPAPAARSPRPAPLAGFCNRSSAQVLFVGSAILLRASSPGGFRNLPRPRRRGAGAYRCPSLLHLFCCGAFAAPLLHVSRPCPHRIAGFSAPTVRLPLSGSCAGSDRRAGGHAPAGLSLRSAQRCRSAGFFSAGALSSAQGVRGFPLSRRLARFAPLPPCSSARRQATFFVSPGGRGVRGSCSQACACCASRGGRAARPPAPRGAPTRRAVFFMVFCFLRFCNFR